jgi:hypothetical protein
MRFTSIVSVLSAVMLLQACGGDEASDKAPIVSPSTDESVLAGATTMYTITGLNDDKAYRVTLVVSDNITVNGAAGTFKDLNEDGAADAGASEGVALITKVNGAAIVGVKTYPAASDNPDMPSGIRPQNGQITVEIMGVAGGKVFPVVYENGGSTTFLEVDDTGKALENYAVGGGLTVSGSSGNPVVIPNVAQTLAVGDKVDYTIYGLQDDKNYRITLVVGDNVDVNLTSGMFVDADGNGAADAGASEAIALINTVNGTPNEPGTKTVPAPDDDPANPTGVVPSGGKITVTITGIAAGTVYPVAYVNGGTSTLLEVGADGTPTEIYSIGGAINVQ